MTLVMIVWFQLMAQIFGFPKEGNNGTRTSLKSRVYDTRLGYASVLAWLFGYMVLSIVVSGMTLPSSEIVFAVILRKLVNEQKPTMGILAKLQPISSAQKASQRLKKLRQCRQELVWDRRQSTSASNILVFWNKYFDISFLTMATCLERVQSWPSLAYWTENHFFLLATETLHTTIHMK